MRTSGASICLLTTPVAEIRRPIHLAHSLPVQSRAADLAVDAADLFVCPTQQPRCGTESPVVSRRLEQGLAHQHGSIVPQRARAGRREEVVRYVGRRGEGEAVEVGFVEVV